MDAISAKNCFRGPSPELLTEAAGVKIFMTPLPEETQDISQIVSIIGKINIILKSVDTKRTTGKSCGFHLTKSKWDPYPWVSYVETGSPADVGGLRPGDCLINIDDKDVIGFKVKDIATLIYRDKYERDIKLSVWRDRNEEEDRETGLALKGPLPDVAKRLVNAVSGAVRALECPVCLESSMPPVSQCVHGHIICVGCRPRTARCPVCRVRLGQGRCLIADKLYRIFHDIFDVKDEISDNTESETWSLRDRLFGKSKKKKSPVEAKPNGAISKPCQLLLTKLFRGGLEKAASADNLTTVSERTNHLTTVDEAAKTNRDLNERLNLHDRMKSASTGELSRETKERLNNILLHNGASNSVVSSTNSLTSSVPNTPTWGGSTESLSTRKVTCPLWLQNNCEGTVAPDTLLEHLSRIHEIPQIHFYSSCMKLPLPLPFGSEAVYILHYAGDIFFFQCDQERAWMTCPCMTIGNNMWEWSLHGVGKDGTEIKLRRNVVSLETSVALAVENIAPLPNSLLLHTLKIELSECRAHEKLDI